MSNFITHLGQELVIVENLRGSQNFHPATVTKIGRIWAHTDAPRWVNFRISIADGRFEPAANIGLSVTTSVDAYHTACARQDAWKALRSRIYNTAWRPPEHLTLDHIQRIGLILDGKQ